MKFKCSQCDKSFKKKHGLKVHTYRMHKGIEEVKVEMPQLTDEALRNNAIIDAFSLLLQGLRE